MGIGMSTITRADFARLMNVNRSTVTRWIEAGRIKLAADGNIDPESATAMLPKTASPMPHHMARVEQIAEQKALLLPEADATPSANRATGSDIAESIDRSEQAALRLKLARVAREEAEAEIAAMKRDEQAKLLVQRADAEFVMLDFARTLGALLERLADRYTPEVMSCQGNSQAIHKVLSDAGRDIRTELSHQMRRRAAERLGSTISPG